MTTDFGSEAPRLGADDRPGGSTQVVIVGAGFSGIAAGIRLLKSGRQDFVIIERSDGVGGTWRDNVYPGAGCDIPSLVYSYSFAQNPDWRTAFGSQAEILDYLEDCVDRFGLRRHIRLGEELLDAAWDDDAVTWTITTSHAKLEASMLVLATGYLSEPRLPDIDGIDAFEGLVVHTARWDPTLSLAGKDVAVVGTGASAIQLVPAIAGEVASMTLYQRTPSWVNAKPDAPVSERERRRRRAVPGYQRAQRNLNKYGREFIAFLMSRPGIISRTLQPQIEKYLAEQVPDPELRRILKPDYTVGCKRILFSNDYYPALMRDNVTVVPHAVDSLQAETVTAGGVAREHEVVVFATGFDAIDRAAAHLIRARGVTLSEHWARSMTAYVGTAVHGFPNLVTMLGPNTALGHHSQTVMLEAQADHLVAQLDYMDRNGVAALEVRKEAQDRYNAWLDQRLEGTVWQAGGCSSWYQREDGRNPSTYPTYTWNFRRHLRRVRPTDYHITTAVPAVPSLAGA